MKNLKKAVAIVLTFAIAMSMGIAMTVAYFTDTEEEVNVMTVGNVNVELIEQQRNEDGSALVPFEDGKALTPIVGSAQGDKDEWGMPEIKNYVDKIVYAKNIGAEEAYMRILVAIPAVLEDTVASGASGNALHWNFGNRLDKEGDSTWNIGAWQVAGNPFFDEFGTGTNSEDSVVIDGVEYNVYEFLSKEAYKKGEETAAPIVGFYLDEKVDYDDETEKYYMGDVEINYDFSKGVNIPVILQAVQADGFADAAAAFTAAFPEKIGTYFTDTIAASDAATDADFEDAVKDPDAKNIIVELTEDVTYDVAAWQDEAMGGEKTDKIIIYGNGHKITFNHKGSDWDNIVTNGAKLVINDAVITNSGYNNGPWNRHDLNFACDVELNNVTSDKAMAFKANAKLTNVTISDANTSDTYAIWVQPNGQTVELDGCTIDMLDCTDGRGLKIDEQYVAAPEKVTLVVKDTTFKTEEKSAILVKSVAGADITLENVDISGVAADSTNEVWVDEASTAYADLVTVAGGTKILEP